MKKSRFSDSQILAILKQAESGAPVANLCREHGMSNACFYQWRSKFGGMDASMMKRLKELEDENRRLKKMYADERLKAEMVQEAFLLSHARMCPKIPFLGIKEIPSIANLLNAMQATDTAALQHPEQALTCPSVAPAGQ